MRRPRRDLHDLYRRAVAYVDRRNGAGMRRGGRVGGGTGGTGSGSGDRFDNTKLYGLSDISAANFFRTPDSGGEAGVATGFGEVFLVRVRAVDPAAQQFFGGKRATGGWQALMGTNGLISAFMWSDSSTFAQVSLSFPSGKFGRLCLLFVQHTGTSVRVALDRMEVIGSTAIANFFPANPATQWEYWGVNHVGTEPSTKIDHLARMAWRGVPSDEQLRALADQTRMLGDLPATFPLSVAGDADIAALAPRHWYRADTFTPNAGNLGALTNRNTTVGGQLNVAAGTIALPAADAQFNNALSVVLNGTQRLKASHAATEFTFLQTGPCEVIAVFARSSVAANGILLSDYVAGPGFDLILDTASNYSYRIHNGSAYIVAPASTGGATGLNVPTYIDVSFSTAGTPQFFGYTRESLSFSGAPSGAASASAPNSALNVGAREDGSSPFSGKLLDLIILDYRLSESDRQKVRDYIRIRYGIGVVVATHRWSLRDVLRATRRRVADGQTAPASLPDTITAATVDSMNRQGAPTVRLIDPSVEGRKTYGFLGATATAYLEGASLARTAATGYWFAVWATPWSIAANGQTYKWLIEFGATNYACKVYISNGSGLIVQGSNINTPTVTLTSLQVGQPMLVTGVMRGSSIEGYINGVSMGAPAACTDTGAASILRLGASLNNAAWALDWSVFGYAMGRVAGGITAQEVADHYAACARAGRILPIYGKTEHHVDLTQDIIDNGGPDNGIPAQALDRIGTDHLTKVGGLVVSNGGITNYTTVNVLSTLAGIRANPAGFWAEVLFISTTGVTDARVMGTIVGATSGWSIYSYGTSALVNFSDGTAVRSSAFIPITNNTRYHVAIRHTGTAMETYINGVLSHTASFPVVAAVPGPMYLGAAGASSQVVLGGSGSDAFVPTPAEISAAAATALSTGKVVGVPGKTSKRWSIVDDVIEAGNNLPLVVKDRQGTDNITTINPKLEVAQRVEHVWSYETAPIMQATSSTTSGNRWESAVGKGIAGSPNALFLGILLRIAGTTFGRVLSHGLSGAAGWNINSVNGTSILVNLWDGTGTLRASPGITVVQNRLMYIGVVFDGTSFRVTNNRTQVGSATTCPGFTVDALAGDVLCAIGGGGSPNPDVRLIGYHGGSIAIPSLAQLFANEDACIANERIMPITGYSEHLYEPRVMSGTTILDQIGNHHLTVVGTPTITGIYDHAA